MKPAHSHAFVNHLLVYSLVAIGFTGSVGLGTVWTRREISLLANENKALATQIAEVERHCQEDAARIAAQEDPATLEQRNIQLALGLVPPEQIIRVTDDPERLLALKRNEGLLSDRPAIMPARIGGPR
ncbi:MAG TPA: hypothetical protein VHC86_05000 [Opitutaceae bacterium]|nr:hypothetical protein [Opitutaceae bacterium]